MYAGPGLPGLLIKEFATNSTVSPGLKVGPYSSFANIGLLPEPAESVDQRDLHAGQAHDCRGRRVQLYAVEHRQQPHRHCAGDSRPSRSFWKARCTAPACWRASIRRRERTSRIATTGRTKVPAYVQDKWQALSNLSITAGVRYDYHGGLTEKYGNIFNFDPSAYDVTGTTTSGFTVNNAGFVVAGNNKY